MKTSSVFVWIACLAVALSQVSTSHALENGDQMVRELRRGPGKSGRIREGNEERPGGREGKPGGRAPRGKINCTTLELSTEEVETCGTRFEAIKANAAVANCSSALDSLSSDEDKDAFCKGVDGKRRGSCAAVLLKGFRRSGRKCRCLDEFTAVKSAVKEVCPSGKNASDSRGFPKGGRARNDRCELTEIDDDLEEECANLLGGEAASACVEQMEEAEDDDTIEALCSNEADSCKKVLRSALSAAKTSGCMCSDSFEEIAGLLRETCRRTRGRGGRRRRGRRGRRGPESSDTEDSDEEDDEEN